MTITPATIYGTSDHYGAVRTGFDADLVVWDGDPLEPSAAPVHLWVRGLEVDLEHTRQRALARRYAPAAQRSGIPPAYRQ